MKIRTFDIVDMSKRVLSCAIPNHEESSAESIGGAD